MRQRTDGRRITLALAIVAAGCGEVEPRTALERELAARTPCNPLQADALEASLLEPLAVGRTRSGTVYAVTRVGENEVVWRSLGDQLIAYRVFQQNQALGATIFGVDAGSEGFALTLRSELGMPSLALYSELERATAPNGTSTITGGTFLEMLGPEVLAEFEVATAVSPAQIFGAFQLSSVSDLFVIRAGEGTDPPLAVFQNGLTFGGRDIMLEREVTDRVRQPDGGVELQFDFFGEQASLHVDATGRDGRLVAASGESTLGPAGRVGPLQLARLEFHCATPVREDWTLPAARSPLAEMSCAEPEQLEHCLELSASAGSVELTADGGEVRELDGARVLEVGSGLPPSGHYSVLERTVPVAQQTHISWARLEHVTGEAWLAVMIAEPSLPVGVGDTISLRASKGPNAWEGQRSELTARSASGELLFWLGDATRPSEFRDVPEFEFTLGPERCVRSTPCVQAAFQHALDSWRIDGDATSVAYGEQLQQGPFRVHNGGVERLTQVGCTDIPEGWLHLGVWRTGTSE